MPTNSFCNSQRRLKVIETSARISMPQLFDRSSLICCNISCSSSKTDNDPLIYRYFFLFAGKKQHVEKFVQTCWTLINDSLYTTLGLEYEADIVAVGVMYFALKMDTDLRRRLKLGAKNGQKWWERFFDEDDVTEDNLKGGWLR